MAIFSLVIMGIMNTSMYGFICDHYALEVYHWPRWLQAFMIQQTPWLKYKLDDKVIKPKAEKRAARFRAQLAAMRGPNVGPAA